MSHSESLLAAPADERLRIPPALPAGQPVLSPAEWGMAAFLLSEFALFSTLIVTYLNFLGQDKIGPTPGEALSLPLVIGTTICLLSSSLTVHLAAHRFAAGAQQAFAVLWGLTILLGLVFLIGTAYEWRELIERYHLTISRNLFGTTYYTLVGFHGLHVTIGLIVLTMVLVLAVAGRLKADSHRGIELVSWYWHFVDGVWIVVFTVVYLVGR